MATVLQQLAVNGSLGDVQRRVADLLRKATGPMHVPQPDGTTLRLCYVGRIQRAMEKMSAAPAEARGVMLPRYEQLVAEANGAWQEYVEARERYMQQCARAGVTPVLPEERACDCPVCAGPQADIRFVGEANDDSRTEAQGKGEER